MGEARAAGSLSSSKMKKREERKKTNELHFRKAPF